MASNDGNCRFADWLLKVCAGEQKGYGVCFSFLVVVFSVNITPTFFV